MPASNLDRIIPPNNDELSSDRIYLPSTPWVAVQKNRSVVPKKTNLPLIMGLSPEKLTNTFRSISEMVADFRLQEGVADNFLQMQSSRARELAKQWEKVSKRPDGKSKWDTFCRLYIEAARLDGTAVPAPGFAISDQLRILFANDPAVDEIFGALMTGYSAPSTFGDYMRRMLGLRQKHVRTLYSTFNAAGQPLTGKVLIYDSGVDLNNDTGPGWALATGEYDFTATYDGSGRLAEAIAEEIA